MNPESHPHDPELLERRPERKLRGRGAVGNESGRFERLTRHRVEDGWEGGWEDNGSESGAASLSTRVAVDASRSVIARNSSPDVPFDRSINPYRGCEHGCVYCFARPTHAWLGLSPGLDFESRLFVKPEAAALLRAELARPSYRCRPLAMAANTDPYQPIERRYTITRQILEVLSDCDHPVAIITKSALVTRDIDILAPMAERGLASVALSVTTLDGDLARRMEPRAASPARRLETIATLVAAGIPVTVLVAPVIPALTDMELERILEAAAEAGARRAAYILLRLPLEIKELFADWLEAHYPARRRHVLNRLREMHGGRLYRSRFGERQTGSGAAASLLARRFDLARKRFGLNHGDWALDTTRFRPPAKGAAEGQLSLF